MPCPHYITITFKAAKHSLVTFLNEPRDILLVAFSLGADTRQYLSFILYSFSAIVSISDLYQQKGSGAIWGSNTYNFVKTKIIDT